MNKRVRVAVLALTTVATLATGAVVVWAGTTPVAFGSTTLTYRQLAMLAPGEQAAILDPLRTVADAAGTVGRSELSSIYSGVRIDAPKGTVTVYLTDLGRADDYRAAIRRTDSSAKLDSLRFARGGYPFATLTAAADSVMTQQTRVDLGVESVSVPSDGSGLRVKAFDVGRTQQVLSSAAAVTSSVGSIPMTFEKATATFTDYSRRKDRPDWISGAALTQASDNQTKPWTCTSGLPARRRDDNRSFLVTAGHCYGNGAHVYTGWENGSRNYIGQVWMRNELDDAIAIDTGVTGTTASREWDGLHPGPYLVFDVSGVGYSYTGDMTCQDGYTSGIVCGLLVEDGYATWTDGKGIRHRGVQARQVNYEKAGRPGDSGGLVFAFWAGNRQARGIVSNGDNHTIIRWTEAPAILNIFALNLAP